MSYARFANSDVYVFGADSCVCCCMCKLTSSQRDDLFFRDEDAMIAHLHEHVSAGHLVLEDTFKELMSESDYVRGTREAWLSMLSECLKNLGYNNTPGANAGWVVEREEIALKVRELCEVFGDTDYPPDLHLADVLEKHLLPHLRERHQP